MSTLSCLHPYGIYYEARRFLLRPLQVQRPFRQALRGMGELQDQEGGAGAKDHGRKGTAGRHVPHARHHDGGGDAVQMDPDPVHQAQMVSQDLHPVCGDGAEPYRAVYRETVYDQTSSCSRMATSSPCRATPAMRLPPSSWTPTPTRRTSPGWS